MPIFGDAGDSPSGTAVHQHPRDLRADDQPGARPVGVGEPGLDDRLLGAHPAPKAAVAALLALRAFANAAWHRIDVPAELDATLLQLALAGRGLVVLLADPEPLADRVQRIGVIVGGERRDALRGPLGSDLLRRRERGRVIDDRAAAEARAGDQRNALIDRAARRRLVVTGDRGELGAVEVLIVVIATGLDHDHVEPGARQPGGRGPAARPRT